MKDAFINTSKAYKHKQSLQTHTDESSTCLSGVVRGSGVASHRPQLKHFT